MNTFVDKYLVFIYPYKQKQKNPLTFCGIHSQLRNPEQLTNYV